MKAVDNLKLFFLTKKAQKIILDKVKSVDGSIVLPISEIFEKVTSQIVKKNDMLGGSYNTSLEKIEYYGDEHLNIHVALHENLHAASKEKHPARVEPYDYISHNIGLEKDGKYFVENKNRIFTESLCYGQSINEAFTEYFTHLLLAEHNLEPKEDSYLERRAVISPFFYKWDKKGEIMFDNEMANNMFVSYINSDTSSFVELITSEYFSTKAKVLKLIFEMDMLADAEIHANEIEMREWLARCMQTVFDIHFDRYHHNHPKRTKADFVNRHNSRVIFPIGNSRLIKDSIQLAKINFLSEPKIRKNNEFADFDKFLINTLYDANSNNMIEIARAKFANDIKILSNPIEYDQHYLNNIKDFSGIEKLDFILFCANMQSFRNARYYHEFLKKVIPTIAKYGMPKHKDARNQAMFYLLNLPAYRFGNAYQYFTPKEIVDYIQNDKQHIAVNMKTLNNYAALKNYLGDNIQDLIM